MNEELLQKAIALFETPEKWNAFCELSNQKDVIQNRWWKKLQQTIYTLEKSPDIYNQFPDWEIFQNGNDELRWHLRNESKDTLVIYFSRFNFGLFAYWSLDESKFIDVSSELSLLNKTYKFPTIDNDKRWLLGKIELIKLPFLPTNIISNESLSWFIGHNTENFAKNLIAEVRKFQTPETTALFKEINEKCKKE